jgi:hypothetical protein
MHSRTTIQIRALSLLVGAVVITLIAVCGQSLTQPVGPWVEARYQEVTVWLSKTSNTLSPQKGSSVTSSDKLCCVQKDAQATNTCGDIPPTSQPIAPPNLTATSVASVADVTPATTRFAGKQIAELAADQPFDQRLPRRADQIECEAQTGPAPGTSSVAWNSPANGSPETRIAEATRRLREMGATWYALDPWGSEGNFRFVCKMAIGGSPEFARMFQAVDRDPLRAVERVLQDVTVWRTQ